MKSIRLLKVQNPLKLEQYFLTFLTHLTKVWHYLRNIKQRVVPNGSYSNYSTIESGVPEGSVLGPLLFLVYINDLERNIKSNVNFFADDTMLFSIVKHPEITANDLNHD